MFVFIINWEGWFFGIKLAGWPAGILLFSKGIVSTLLVVLLLKNEGRRILWSSVSVGFLAFVFILPVFSSQRNMRTEAGWTVFWAELVILIIIPVILMVACLVMNHKNQAGAT